MHSCASTLYSFPFSFLFTNVARDLVGFSLWSLAYSLLFSAALLLLFQYLYFSLLVSLLHFSWMRACIFVRCYVSKGCGVLLSMPFLSEEFCFLRYLLSSRRYSRVFVLCSYCGDIVNPSSLIWVRFSFRGFVCTYAFYPAVLQTYTCGLCDSAYPGLSISFWGWCGCECCLLRLLPIHVCLYSSWLDDWLPCPCSDWHMTHDGEMSPAGLICCYAMNPRHVDTRTLVIRPLFAWQLGLLTFILSWPSS